MVRKAETLKSLDELNMSARSKSYLMGRFGSLDKIIWDGRCAAYIHANRPDTIKKSRKSTIELVSALDEAGFVRHDINPGSFCIGRLYRWVFPNTIDPATMPAGLNDLYETVEKVSNTETIYHFNCHMGNEKYESFENPTYDQLKTVKWSLKTNLTPREYEVLAYRIGFEDGNFHDLGQTSKHFLVTCERIRQVETKAIRKLRARKALPSIIPTLEEQREEVVNIIKEIEELRKNPVHRREAELIQRLRIISKMPFEHAKEAAKYLDGGILDFSEIEKLNLSIRTYNCLKRAGINTIADIVKLPKEDWPKVRNLGYRAMVEIEIRMREAGYSDFNISDSNI